jgi:DNA-binding FadR family transcriptional regulator
LFDNNFRTDRYDIEFHQTLADISQNMVLKHLLLAISTMIKRFLEDYVKIPETSKSAISYHKRIIKALVEKKFRFGGSRDESASYG